MPTLFGYTSVYITSMIVVRNVTVTRKKSVASKPVVLPILINSPGIFKTMEMKNPTVTHAPVVAQATMISKPATKVVDGARAAPTVKTSFVVHDVQSIAMKPVAINPQAQLSPPSQVATKYVDVKYVGTTINTPNFTIPVKSDESSGAAASPPPTEVVTETYSSEGVVVVAYICKRVPRPPNPDAQLVWSP